MKILNDMRLKLDNPNWAVDPELALIDTILNQNPKLYEIGSGGHQRVEPEATGGDRTVLR